MGIIKSLRKLVYSMTNNTINIYESDNKLLSNQEINKYKDLYNNSAPWITKDVRSLNLCYSIMQEIIKSTLAEYKLVCYKPKDENSKELKNTTINVNKDEDINKDLENTNLDINKLEGIKEIQDICDEISKIKYNFLAKLGLYGNVLIRPYISGDYFGFSVFGADSFNVEFDSYGNVIEALIYNVNKKKNKTNNLSTYYTLLESHKFYKNYMNGNNAHVIKYKLFKSSSENYIGMEIPLTYVEDYSDLEPEIIIEGVERNLCVFVPLDNTEYFIGKSYFENAYNLFEDADRQYSSVLWEYKGGELAIDADESLFRKEKNSITNKTEYKLPEGRERLYRTVSQANIVGDNKLPMNIFAPALRDTSYWQGLNNIKRNIELTLGLSYGVISEPTNVAMTATEIVSSKQRYYTTIKNFQKLLIMAFTEAIQNMIVLFNASNKPITDNYDLHFHFDDGILTTTKEKVDELAVLLNNNIITVEEAREKYFENT